MKVLNVHQRELPVSASRAGTLLDSLASPADALWPRRTWPPMRLDRPLGVGAVGGHGPIRYVVEEYVRGECVCFRFSAPPGFDGQHRFDVVSLGHDRSLLRHSLAMRTSGTARLTWPLVFRPLHDALIEDAFAEAETALGLPRHEHPWSIGVRVLRWFAGGRRRARRGMHPPTTNADTARPADEGS